MTNSGILYERDCSFLPADFVGRWHTAVLATTKNKVEFNILLVPFCNGSVYFILTAVSAYSVTLAVVNVSLEFLNWEQGFQDVLFSYKAIFKLLDSFYILMNLFPPPPFFTALQWKSHLWQILPTGMHLSKNKTICFCFFTWVLCVLCSIQSVEPITLVW